MPNSSPQKGVDGSSTVTLGGTAQNLFGSVVPTSGFQVSNPDPTEDLWISWSTTAVANGVGAHKVAANGGEYVSDFKPTVAISIVAATTGHKFTATYW